MASNKKLVACALALFASLAQASLSKVDGSLTLDSETQLLWLNLPETAGQSFNQIRQSQWIAEGFRYATLGEVKNLFAHAGVSFGYDPTTGLSGSAGFGEDAQQLAALLGVTLPKDGATSLVGVVGTDSNNATVTEQNHPIDSVFSVVELSLASKLVITRPDPIYFAIVTGKSVPSIFPVGGSFLVKNGSPVPEPSTASMLLIGIAAGALLKKKSTAKA